MLKICLACFCLAVCLCGGLNAQEYAQKLSVPLTASVETQPPAITLRWKRDPQASGYIVRRRNAAGAGFFAEVASLPASDSSWTDTNVVPDFSYEYLVWETGTSGVGYLNSGIGLSPVHSRGRLILVVDSTVALPLAAELQTLRAMLEGDGWTVARLDVPRTWSAAAVKQRILQAYQQAPAITNTVFLLGHVPVPYSGNLGPDGHSNHIGAWACDGYYADVDGVWPDVSVNNTTSSDPRNHNVPADGKFDPSTFPSALELQVGRVDFHNLPAFPLDEIELLRRYLQKDFAWRLKQFTVRQRAAIEDNFQSYSEGFAQNGWKNFAPLVGADSVRYRDWDYLKQEDYLWAYGCGGGWYQGASGIAETQSLVDDTLKAVFALTFGSYFGDWDSPDNLLRAVLAAPGTVLSNAWAGRPNWMLHHLGLGHTLGYATRVSQNNTGAYVPGFGAGFVHIALMGDPTLRMSIVAPPAGPLLAEAADGGIALDFGDSPEAGPVAYFVYRRPAGDSVWTLRTPSPLAESAFLDSCLTAGETFEYMVKTVRLERTPSGTYWNTSQGIFAGPATAPAPLPLSASFTTDVDPLTWLAQFDATLENATGWTWDFGDGSTSGEEDPSHLFPNGQFIVTLTAFGPCGQLLTVSDTLDFAGAAGEAAAAGWRVFPNPASNRLWLENGAGIERGVALRLTGPDGRVFFRRKNIFLGAGERYSLDLNNCPAGLYCLEIQTDSGIFFKKIVLQN